MVAHVTTVAFQGIEAVPVDVQVQIAPGFPGIVIVGLPDKAVAESRERVRAALHASGLALPPKRIVVNLAPADLPKEGSHYDNKNGRLTGFSRGNERRAHHILTAPPQNWLLGLGRDVRQAPASLLVKLHELDRQQAPKQGFHFAHINLAGSVCCIGSVKRGEIGGAVVDNLVGNCRRTGEHESGFDAQNEIG